MHHKIFIFIFVFILSYKTGYSQNSNKLEKDDLIEQMKQNLIDSKQLFSTNAYDSGLMILSKNLYDSLLNHASKEIAQIATDSYFNAMGHNGGIARYDNAIFYGEKALTSKVISSTDRCKVMTRLADICYRIGNYEKGINFARKAIELTQEQNLADSESIIFNAYQTMGLIAIEQNKYNLAQKYLLYSLRVIGEKPKSPYTALMAVGNMAVLHYKFNNYDSSKYYYQKAIETLKLFKGHYLEYRVPFIRSQIYNNLSGVYLLERDFTASYEHLKVAYDFMSTKYPADNPLIIELEIKLGSVLSEIPQKDSAEFYLTRALKNSLANNDSRERYAIEAYYQMGKYYSRKKEFQQSIIFYDSALALNVKYMAGNDSIFSRPKLAMLSLEKRLEAYRNVGSLDDFTEVLDTTFDELKDFSQGANPFLSNPDLTASVKDLAGKMIQDFQSISEQMSENEFSNKVITLVEISKAAKLYAQNTYTAALKQLPDFIKKRDKNLRDSLRLYAGKASDKTSDSISYLLSSKLDLLKEEVRKDFPKAFEYKYNGSNYSLTDIQKELAANTTLFSFLYNDSTFHMLAINKKQCHVKSYAVEDDHKTIIEKALANEFQNGMENLIIIPDGPIWDVNFDLLKSPLNQTRYLIEDVNVVYGFSLETVLNQSGLDKKYEGEVLAFSYGEETDLPGGQLEMQLFRDQSFNSLPGSLKEIQEISQIIKGEYFYGQAASEKTFKEQSSNFRILHLAVHGDMTSDSEGLIFYNQGAEEDGTLHFEELYVMDLDAELAVLSACNTGSGEISPGEGIISLGRAFAYAGVPGLVLSRSDVSDISTPYIMKFFYEGLKDGQRKSVALRNAKKRFLNEIADEHTKDPAYWAPYYVLGDDSPIYHKTNSTLIYLLIVSLILITGILISRKLFK